MGRIWLAALALAAEADVAVRAAPRGDDDAWPRPGGRARR